MKTYIGTKVVKAMPMEFHEACSKHGVKVSMSSTAVAKDSGYLVQYDNGYTSWSPKKVFEEAYKEKGSMSYAEALGCLQGGYKLARAGWNGKGMWVALCMGTKDLHSSMFWNVHSKAHAEAQGGTATVDPYFIMCTAQGSIQMGWNASQADQLATDWVVIE